jgi:hypothetical protein
MLLIPAPFGVLAAALLVLAGVMSIRDQAQIWPRRSWPRLELYRDGTLSIRTANGQESSQLRSIRRHVTRWLVILELEVPFAGRRRFLVARDMLGTDEFRRLRLWALWNSLPATQSNAIR